MTPIIRILAQLKDDYEIKHNKKITMAKVAEISGCSKPAMVNYRKGKVDLPFLYILRMVRFFAQEKETEIMKEICLLFLKLNRLDNIRWAMEYCSLSRNLHELKQIVDDQLNSNNSKNKEWAKIYNITYQYQINKFNFRELYDKLSEIKPTFVETRCFSKILESLFLHWLGDMKYFKRSVLSAESIIDQIDDEYLNYCYANRLEELHAIKSLYLDFELEKSRNYSTKILNSKLNPFFKANSYFMLGSSFLLEDYDKSLYYYKQYMDFLIKTNRGSHAEIVEKQDIVFLKIIWGRDLETVNTYDLSELAHLEARWGDREKALTLLEKAEKEQGTSLFKSYYRSIALNDPKLMFETMIGFINSANKFHAHLIQRDLKKYPVYGEMAEILLNKLSIT